MKAAIISLFVLILIFMLLKYGALAVIGSRAFHYAALLLLAAVFGCAFYFVGVSEKSHQPDDQSASSATEDESDEK